MSVPYPWVARIVVLRVYVDDYGSVLHIPNLEGAVKVGILLGCVWDSNLNDDLGEWIWILSNNSAAETQDKDTGREEEKCLSHGLLLWCEKLSHGKNQLPCGF
jgi:hypothetical protein